MSTANYIEYDYRANYYYLRDGQTNTILIGHTTIAGLTELANRLYLK